MPLDQLHLTNLLILDKLNEQLGHDHLPRDQRHHLETQYHIAHLTQHQIPPTLPHQHHRLILQSLHPNIHLLLLVVYEFVVDLANLAFSEVVDLLYLDADELVDWQDALLEVDQGVLDWAVGATPVDYDRGQL